MILCILIYLIKLYDSAVFIHKIECYYIFGSVDNVMKAFNSYGLKQGCTYMSHLMKETSVFESFSPNIHPYSH